MLQSRVPHYKALLHKREGYAIPSSAWNTENHLRAVRTTIEEDPSESAPDGRTEAVVGEAEGEGSRRQQLDDGFLFWLGVWGWNVLLRFGVSLLESW
jgi:hypothetical protein